MLEYTGDIFGEYLEDFGVSYLRTVGSSSLGFMARNLLLDIFIIYQAQDDIFNSYWIQMFHNLINFIQGLHFIFIRLNSKNKTSKPNHIDVMSL